MKITIKDQEIELIYCQRIYLKYEEMYKKSLNIEDLSSYTATADLFYCTIIATLEHKSNRDKYNITFTKEDFLDWYDDNATILTHDFTQWFFNEVQEQMDKLKKHVEEQQEDKKGAKSKN